MNDYNDLINGEVEEKNGYSAKLSVTKTHERSESEGEVLLRYQGIPEGNIEHCILAPNSQEPMPSVFNPPNSDNAKAVELPARNVPSDPYAVSEFMIDVPKVLFNEEQY